MCKIARLVRIYIEGSFLEREARLKHDVGILPYVQL